MCGIFGLVGQISEPLALECVNALQHRGPDGWGLWHQPEITLGHRRLAILDLSERGRQPMSYAAGRYQITYNGEVYNFLEIRDRLLAKGYRFSSDTDTEVILAAYVEWGPDCLLHFNGMWALGIWDVQEQRLFLGRDRWGKKPLFYTRLPGGGLAFASEMKALFPLLPEVRPNIPLVRDADRLLYYESSQECVIEGIQRFPAGHYGWFQQGQLRLHRWWCTLDHLPEVPRRYEDQVEQLRDLFLDACRLRMRSDVPLGTALSGGLDSSAAISCLAHLGRHDHSRRLAADWQHAFVAGFPGTPLDETAYARRVTDHLGLDLTVIRVDPAPALERLYNYFYLFEELSLTSPIPFMLTYGQIKAHGVTVSLDGHGADEVFGGYSFDFLVALKDAGVNFTQVKAVLDTYYAAYPQDSSQFPPLPTKLGYWALWRAKDLAKGLLRRGYRTVSRDSRHPNWRRLDHLNQRLYMSTHDTVLPTLLRSYDRYSMANGVEIRMPFMDHRLVTFGFALPWSAKIRQGFSKAIVRDAVAPFLVPEITYRKSKIGWNSPIVDWMKGPLKAFFLDLIAAKSFQECPLIQAAAVARQVRRVIADPHATFRMGEQAWTQVSPYLWEQAVIRGQGKP